MQNLQDLLKKVDAILDSADTPEPTDPVPTISEPPTDQLLQGLRTHFGYGAFREGQRQIIEAILDGENGVRCVPNRAWKVHVLPAACSDARRYNRRGFTAYLVDEGPG